MWDPKTGKFEHVAKSLSKRDSQGQAVVGGEIFVVGGYDNISSKYLKTGEKYSPETNKWSRLPNMNMARWALCFNMRAFKLSHLFSSSILEMTLLQFVITTAGGARAR